MIIFLEFVYMVYYIDGFLCIEPSLHPWNIAYLMMVNILFAVLLSLFCKNFIELNGFPSVCFMWNSLRSFGIKVPLKVLYNSKLKPYALGFFGSRLLMIPSRFIGYSINLDKQNRIHMLKNYSNVIYSRPGVLFCT